eukprot:XP_001706437.1 Hypothetical protein GL50803_37953 [Giardia lamblia ATCC 50803]
MLTALLRVNEPYGGNAFKKIIGRESSKKLLYLRRLNNNGDLRPPLRRTTFNISNPHCRAPALHRRAAGILESTRIDPSTDSIQHLILRGDLELVILSWRDLREGLSQKGDDLLRVHELSWCGGNRDDDIFACLEVVCIVLLELSKNGNIAVDAVLACFILVEGKQISFWVLLPNRGKQLPIATRYFDALVSFTGLVG